MQLVRSIESYTPDADLLLSIGVFDGVHAGHRAVLASLVAEKAGGTRTAAMTFEHHPHAFLHPGEAPKVITTADEKINLLAGCGLDLLFLLPFDQKIASLAPEVFLRDVLLGRLRTKLLVVGENWRFGKDRAGDVALAKAVLEPAGCRFEAAVLAEIGGEKVSSSRIRELIGQRRFAEADSLLGSPYTVRGIVVPGDGRGQVLGYPTANIAVPAEKLIPTDGVYGAVAHHDGRDRAAVVSIGTKPTFGGTQQAVEVHLMDFSGSIYGDEIAVRQWRFIRDQERFENASALVDQMARDVTVARSAL